MTEQESGTHEHGHPTFRGLRAVKSFEEQGPVVVWQVSVPFAADLKKLYLTLDANQKSFGVRLEKSRSEDLKAGGAVVTQLRKQLPSGFVPSIYVEPDTGHQWIPFFRDKGPKPAFWIMLARLSPPEVRLVDGEGVMLVRKSSQGSYTKRRTLETPLPDWPVVSGLRDILPELMRSFAESSPTAEAPKDDEASVETAGRVCPKPEDSASLPDGGPSGSPDLPEYQKTARDRLSRRSKTLRKSFERLDRELSSQKSLDISEKKAHLLGAHLHLVRPGQKSLSVVDEHGETVVLELDPTRSPGANLVAAHEAVKKRHKALAKLAEELDRARHALELASGDLAILRGRVLSLIEVQAVMTRHHLSLDKSVTSTAKGDRPEALPYKVYVYRNDGLKHPVRILVGKGAEGSDTLVKEAKANDLWLHIAGSTGSHVIIPVRDLAGAAAPDELLRRAGILAVFHSKLRENLGGEVYFSRKQHIRKRKGMPAGLWQIDKAETTMIRYDAEELRLILSMAAP